MVTADSGEAAVAAFEQQLPDLVVLDLMMPGMDGYAVCQRIRNFSHVPIIMLTGMGSDEEKVRGLDAGADDYVTKPFSIEVLLARIRAVLRRSQATFPAPSDSFKSGNLEIDFTRRRVAVAGNEVRLTPTEFLLLQEMVCNAGKVLLHTHLLNKVWGKEYRDEREYLHVFIRSLRNKLGLEHQGHGAIDSISGVGYRFNG
ncbi:MAG: response regulator transcription factor [Dehalococcoidia bacterium]|nr:response regulator transcription factor [Dehalococcoidia bacterium]